VELEHAIQIAIDFEKKVVKTYQDAAAASQDPVGKRILQVMTQEEGTHVAYLEARLREWKQTGQVSLQKLDTLIPKPEALYAALHRMKKTLEKKETKLTKELALLQSALVAENEASAFYKDLVSQLDGPGKELFARFMEIEAGHVAMVQAELDSVSGVGVWFDFQEVDLGG
jgi:rubrerythrin